MHAATADPADAPAAVAPPPLALARVLGTAEPVRAQTGGVLLSSFTYLVYVAIGGAQVALGLLDAGVFRAVAAVVLLMNLGFYAVVRSGVVAHGPDPGLARTQLLVGIALMFVSYATLGTAAGGLMVVMASHVVYSMFMMRPRQVWQLVGVTLALLAATMALSHHLMPARYPWALQLSNLMYALLVMPLIAMLAHRITGMTQRLKAQHAELAAAMARLHELATRDELTRTHNRRHMAELLQAQQSQHRRLGAPLALALIDIDLFKSVNDRHGHAVGDEVLRGFAQLARASLRGVDELARWGGEEFLVLMPHTRRDAAVHALDRLQQQLAGAEGAAAMPAGLAVSFSAGVVQIGPDEPVDRAVERADQAMYRAKTQGRARCVAG